MTPLSQKVHQTLLADIENTGLPLDQILLVDLCEAKEGVYGAPGKNRPPVQLRFQKIKELTARSYRRLLAKHGITLGPATLAAKQQEQAAKLPDQATDKMPTRFWCCPTKKRSPVTTRIPISNLPAPSEIFRSNPSQARYLGPR
jgi:hypothetical protein